jgi:hopanoid biosynthesis associated protein HpnK
MRPPQSRLVVTADDFGLAVEVNEAVEAAHRGGILSAASLMVAAPAANDAIRRARRMPRLQVGLHLALTEVPAAAVPTAIPALVGEDGRLSCDIARVGAAALSASVRRQIAAEIAAQFNAFRASGLVLDHVDGHQHVHLNPLIARDLIAAVASSRAPFVRVPREPRRVLSALERPAHAEVAALLWPFAALLARRLKRAGIATADAVFGLAWSGAMTRERLLHLLRHLPQGLSEIYTHPATRGGFSGAARGYRYAEELAALLAPEVGEAVTASGAKLGGFRDFA